MIPPSLLPALPRLPLPEGAARTSVPDGATPARTEPPQPLAAEGFTDTLPLPAEPADAPVDRREPPRLALAEGATGAPAQPQAPALPVPAQPAQTLVAQALLAQMAAGTADAPRPTARPGAQPEPAGERQPLPPQPAAGPQTDQPGEPPLALATATPAVTAHTEAPRTRSGIASAAPAPDPRLLPAPSAPAALPPASLWFAAVAICAALLFLAAIWS